MLLSNRNFLFLLLFIYFFLLIFLLVFVFQVFTNSDRIHALRALDRLGIRDCFEQIICFETINPNLPNATRPDEFPVVLKPSLDAFKIALDVANVDPRRTVRQIAKRVVTSCVLDVVFSTLETEIILFKKSEEELLSYLF